MSILDAVRRARLVGDIRFFHSAQLSWKKHREELVPWVFGLIFYFAFMRDSEPSKFTVGMLLFLFTWPLVFTARLSITALRKSKELAAEVDCQEES